VSADQVPTLRCRLGRSAQRAQSNRQKPFRRQVGQKIIKAASCGFYTRGVITIETYASAITPMPYGLPAPRRVDSSDRPQPSALAEHLYRHDLQVSRRDAALRMENVKNSHGSISYDKAMASICI
jgi:hypothetical protein